MEKKLYRDEYRKKVGGVCAGLADHFGMDVSIIRVIFLLTSIFLHGIGLVAYVVLWIALPARYPFIKEPYVDYTVPPADAFNPFKSGAQPNFTAPDFNKPFGAPAKRSNIGVYAGAILIILGSIFLLNNFDLIPHISFNILWPAVLVMVGITFILSGSKKEPWEKAGWNEKATTAEPKAEETDNNNNDNTPTA